MIHDLQQYRASRINPVAVWFDFWFNGWMMFMPRVRIETKIYSFPIKPREPKP